MNTRLVRRRATPRLMLCAITAAATTSCGRGPPVDDLAGELHGWMQRYAIAKGTLAVMRDGQRLVGSYGWDGWEPEQAHRVASMSKGITGVCTARLAQEGRFTFSDSLGVLLASTFQRLGEPVDRRFKTITIEQLLTHRGGLVRDV